MKHVYRSIIAGGIGFVLCCLCNACAVHWNIAGQVGGVEISASTNGTAAPSVAIQE